MIECSNPTPATVAISKYMGLQQLRSMGFNMKNVALGTVNVFESVNTILADGGKIMVEKCYSTKQCQVGITAESKVFYFENNLTGSSALYVEQ